jgi:hypothetical protein
LETGVFAGENASFGTKLLSSSSVLLDDIFVAKHDSSGQVLWARRAGDSGSDCGNGIAVDYLGNSYVTGFFSGTATFGSVILTGSGGTDVFVAKYDAGGELVWVQKAGGRQRAGASASRLSR